MQVKIKTSFLPVLLFFIFFLSGIYFYYLFKFPKPLKKDYLFNYYSEDLILKTGGHLEIPESRIQHFLNFPPEKTENTIRIGAFGCSYTYGKGVNNEASYPYQLQIKLNKQFPDKKVEVFNFGVRGAGFHEQFFLWEEYAKKYGLDYILLGPRTFHWYREMTFREIYSDYVGYPKDRFVLFKDNKAKVKHIKGNTLKIKYNNYYTLFPPYTALRYDIRPFKVWERLFLKNEIQNPFYYKNFSTDEKQSIKMEAAKINILLLEKIRKTHPKKILVILRDKFDLWKGFDTKHYNVVKNMYNINHIKDFDTHPLKNNHPYVY